MANSNSLPIQNSPLASDWLSGARGTAFGAEQKTPISALSSLILASIIVASPKVFTVNNTLTLAGTDGSTLNVGTGGTLGSAAFVATSSLLAVANNLSDVANAA